jgi:Family of unknown function (DUF6502)
MTIAVSENANPKSNTSERVLETAARILAPLVRLLIAKGVTFQMASEVLKQVYVRVAQKQFVDDDEATGTKLSLLTGLNRKEIRRLTSVDVEKRGAPMSSYASAVHSVWRTQRRWLDKEGNPKVLPRRTSNHLLSFDDLVKSVTTDHRPSAVFEELMRLQYIEVDSAENVQLKSMGYVEDPEFEGKVFTVGDRVEDHLDAAITNILEPTPRFLERSVFSDELTNSSAEQLHELARAEWDQIQDKIINAAIALEEKDALTEISAQTRIRVGIYFFSEHTENE